MKFQEVHTLIPNKKYKIDCGGVIVYIGVYLFTGEDGSNTVEIMNTGILIDFPYFEVRFYEPVFQRERIQTAMERRAINLILRNLIGDSTFTW